MTKGIKIGLGIVVISILIYVIGTFYVNNRIVNYLSNEFLKSKVAVQNVSSNLLTGTFTVNGLSTINGKNQKTEVGFFEVSGLGYYQFLVNNKIVVDQIKASDFKIYLPLDQASKSSSEKQLELKRILVSNGTIFNYNSDTLQSRVHGLQIDSGNLKLNTHNIAESLSYQINKIEIDSSFMKLNDSEDVKTKAVSVSSQDVKIEDFEIKTNLTTANQIRKDQVNKDQLSLETSQIEIINYKFKLSPELLFTANSIAINNADFNAKANNNTDKNKVIATYSEQLRNAGIKINIEEIQVNDSRVSYSEPNTANTKRGAITFDNINATFSNFHNIEGNGEIKLTTDAVFMASNKFSTAFSMDPYDSNDSYQWSGNLMSFDLSNINSFLNPVLNMRLKGVVNEYYFSIYGNKNTISADLKIKYDDAQIEFFDKSSISNTLVSGLANLLATNDSNNELVSKTSTIDRSSKETFFNQVWAVQRKGLLEVVKY